MPYLEAGGDNKLAVVLGATSYPGVICDAGQAPSRIACNDIVGDMHATVTRRLFGPDLVAPDVKLPLLLTDGEFLTFPRPSSYGLSDTNGTIVGWTVADNSCWVVVTTSQGPDYSTWYNLWEGASAVEQMCVRRGRNGRATRIG